jgi:hypothetical protein
VFVVGSLIPIAGHPVVVNTDDNPSRMEELVQGNALAQGDEDMMMLAHGYCGGGMQGWQGPCGGIMYCGAGMQGMRGRMMGGGTMGVGMGMMRTMGADQDGKVSKEEMAKHREWMVKALDADGDGQIGAPEMMGMGHRRRMNPE